MHYRCQPKVKSTKTIYSWPLNVSISKTYYFVQHSSATKLHPRFFSRETWHIWLPINVGGSHVSLFLCLFQKLLPWSSPSPSPPCLGLFAVKHIPPQNIAVRLRLTGAWQFEAVMRTPQYYNGGHKEALSELATPQLSSTRVLLSR